MRVLGICRFSYPALGGFKRMHDTVQDREAYLYSPERMELRFRHFETLTLASIAAQRDPDFTFLVLVGDSLPKPYLDRLRDITASVPQVRIVSRPPMKHRLAMQLVLQEELAGTETESIQFRLDDDDAVGTNFIRSIRRTARLSHKMWADWDNFVIEYSSGYAVRLGPEGILAQPVQGQFLACGLAVLFRPSDPKTVMNYGHHKLHLTMPTLIDPQSPMYLRAVHDDNDSRASHSRLAPIDDETRAFFQERFNVTEAAVRAAFCAPTVPPGKG